MRIPSCRLHRGSGQAVVTLAGKDFYLGSHNSPESRRQYQRLIAEYLANREAFLVKQVHQNDLTIAEVIAAFNDYAKREIGGKEYHNIRLAMRPVRSLYGDTFARDFGPNQFKAVRNKIVCEVHPKRKKPRTRVWVNRAMRYVVRLFRWAASEELVSPTIHDTLKLIPPLKRGKTSAPEPPRVMPISIKEVEATLKHLSPVVSAMVRFQLLTGCRPGEVCKLTPGMIDRSSDIWIATLEEHKTAHRGRERFICIGPKAQAILAPFMDRPDGQPLFSPAESEQMRRVKKSANRVTSRSQGNRPGYSARVREGRPAKRAARTYYDTRSYAQAIEYAANKAKVKPWGPNRLRHTAATRLRADVDIETAKAVLGHTEVTTTQIYAEQDRTKAIEAARRFG
jgi:integrase